MSKDFLLHDSWAELVFESPLYGKDQRGYDIEAELIQPLILDTPELVLPFLKKAWSYCVFSKGEIPTLVKEAFERALLSPFVKADPISRVLSFLIGKRLNIFQPPLVPMHPVMPLYKSCELALLWAIAGERVEAQRLGEKILSLTSLRLLWCKEEEYEQEEMTLAIDLLKRGFSLETKPHKKITDLFFLALVKEQVQFDPVPLMHKKEEPDLGLFFQRTDRYSAALTLTGENSSLGSFLAKDVEIRAFGPQRLPLSDGKGFGITRFPDSQPIEGWTAMSDLPEVWLDAKPFFEKDSFHISIRYLGIKPEMAVFFSLFVKADFCEIEGKKFFSKTLERYQGPSKPVQFGTDVQIMSDLAGKMELIPLSGEKQFWGADFLLAFEVNPFEGRGEYRFFAKNY